MPFPPSTNNLFASRSQGGRAKTGKYRTWQRLAALSLRPIEKVPGPVRLDFLFGAPDNRRRDLDNYLKAPIDLLVKCGAIDDDRNVCRLSAAWATVEGINVTVTAI